MSTESSVGGGEQTRQLKVSRLLEKYDIEEFGDWMEDKWTASGDEHRSLRDIANEFNLEIMRAELHTSSFQVVEGEVENLYENLTADRDGQAKVQTKRRLEREGVDADELLNDFVSYQAVRTYLQQERGAEYESEVSNDGADVVDDIKRLKSRLSAVTETKIEQLARDGTTGVSEPTVLVDVNISCASCGSRLSLENILSDDACDCMC